MYLMARGSALPRCTVLNKVSNKSSTNFCRVPWGGVGQGRRREYEVKGGGGGERQQATDGPARWCLGPILPWKPVCDARPSRQS